MVELKKEYTIFCSRTIVRHEVTVDHCLFHERIQRDSWQENMVFNTIKEAEDYIKEIINNFKSSLKPDEITLEKDFNNNTITGKLYIASEGDYIRYRRKTMRRKKSPYFTIYIHYAVTESMYGYGDNEIQWQNDHYTDEFRYPIYAY